MPYLVDKDKADLNPLIENLRARVVALSYGHDNMVEISWGYKRYIARKVLVDTALNAAEQYQGRRATRYWLLVDHAGIALNIGLELYRRVLAHKPDGGSDILLMFFEPSEMPSIPEDAQALDAEIDALVREIAKIGGQEGYNYDGAYCGLDNYSLTELLPRILLSVLEANSCDIEWDHIESLVIFWLTMARELYTDVAHEYEDEQIKKNGDVKVYQLILERLKSKK